MVRICGPVGKDNSAKIFSKDNCFFPNEKGLKLIPKITKKTQNFPFFKLLNAFLSNFRQTSSIRMLRSVSKENVLVQ